MGGLNVLTYTALMAGGTSGPAVLVGDPENSTLIVKQTTGIPHFANFSASQLEIVRGWIMQGAIEE